MAAPTAARPHPRGLRPGSLVSGVLVAALVTAGAARACVIDADCFTFDPCLVNARCIGGDCRYNRRNCNDNNPCTNDRCDSLVGCINEPVCPSDGLVCNGEERCSILVAGLCFQGPRPNCDDGNACTIDSCVEPTGCRHVPVSCADGNPCTRDWCDPALGCRHDPIENCCRTLADCPTDACTERSCSGGVCTQGTPISCDDGDESTVDGCNPTTGCTHTPLNATTTTVPGGGGGGPCTSATDCPLDDDPCTEERCTEGRCTIADPSGFERLGCVCRRSLPAACAGEQFPRKLDRRVLRACTAVGKARDATAKRQTRLLAKAGKQFGKASRLAERAGTQGALSGPCAAAASARMTDAVSRAAAIRRGS